MSIINSLGRIKKSRQNSSTPKQTLCDVDLTVDDCSSLASSSPISTLQPSHSETGLGLLDYEASAAATSRELGAKKKLRGSYTKYSDNQRHAIGKYASEYSTASTLRRYKDEFPELSESTVRTMRKKYEEEIRNALRQKRQPSNTLKTARRGRPLLLGPIDLMVQNYLRVNAFFIYFNKRPSY